MARKPAAPAAKGKQVTEAQILSITQGEAFFCLIGTSPLIFNRMAEKAKRALLMGSTRMNDAEKAANIKHNPPDEYRRSVYRNSGDRPATRLKFPSPAFKGTVKTAALDMPGATKTAMGRRIWVPGFSVDIYGVPQMLCSIVRSADIARTPDVRTRAILPEWCCQVSIRFAQPLVTHTQLATLFAAGGILCGIGDWRQEKGSGSFGQFRLCDKSDADFKRIMREGGCVAQDKALEHITCYDEDTVDMLETFHSEIVKRGRDQKGRAGVVSVGNDDDELSEAA
jgi:hypothetical protein